MANIADVSIKINGYQKLIDWGDLELVQRDKETFAKFSKPTSLGYDYMPEGLSGVVTVCDDETIRIDTTGRWCMDNEFDSWLYDKAEEYGFEYQWIALEGGCDYEDEGGNADLGLYLHKTIEDCDIRRGSVKGKETMTEEQLNTYGKLRELDAMMGTSKAQEYLDGVRNGNKTVEDWLKKGE